MWFATLPNGKTIWIQPGHSYTIGRKTNDLVLGLKSVSKLHATIQASPVPKNSLKHVNEKYDISIIDHQSKGGTYVNGSTERVAAGSALNLTNQCVQSGTSTKNTFENYSYLFLQFGKIRSPERYDEIQLSWVPIVITYSSGKSFSDANNDKTNLSHKLISQYSKYLEPLGIKMIPEFLRNTVIYIDTRSALAECQNESSNSNKLMLALVRNLPIVTPEYTQKINEYLREANQKEKKSFSIQFRSPFNTTSDNLPTNNYTPTSAYKISQSAVVQGLFPDYKAYIPNDNCKLAPESSRKLLFKGLLFVIWGNSQHVNLEPIIVAGGGQCVLYANKYLDTNAVSTLNGQEELDVVQSLTKFLDLQANSPAHRGAVRVVPVQPEHQNKEIEKQKVLIMMRAARRQALNAMAGMMNSEEIQSFKNSNNTSLMASKMMSTSGKLKVFKPVCLSDVATSIRNISVTDMLKEIDTENGQKEEEGFQDKFGDDASLTEIQAFPAGSEKASSATKSTSSNSGQKDLPEKQAVYIKKEQSSQHPTISSDVAAEDSGLHIVTKVESQDFPQRFAKNSNPFLSSRKSNIRSRLNFGDTKLVIDLKDSKSIITSDTLLKNKTPDTDSNTKPSKPKNSILRKGKFQTGAKSMDLFDLWSANPQKTEKNDKPATNEETHNRIIESSRNLLSAPVSASTPNKTLFEDIDNSANITHISGTDNSVEVSDISEDLPQIHPKEVKPLVNALKRKVGDDKDQTENSELDLSSVTPIISGFNIFQKRRKTGFQSNDDTQEPSTEKPPQDNDDSNAYIEKSENPKIPEAKTKISLREALLNTKRSLAQGKLEMRGGRIVKSTSFAVPKVEKVSETDSKMDIDTTNTNNELSVIKNDDDSILSQDEINKIKNLVHVDESMVITKPSNLLQQYHLNPLPESISMFDIQVNDKMQLSLVKDTNTGPQSRASSCRALTPSGNLMPKPLKTVIMPAKGNEKWSGRKNFKTFRKVIYDKASKARVIIDNGSVFGGGVYGKANTVYGELAVIVAPNSSAENGGEQQGDVSNSSIQDRITDVAGAGNFVVLDSMGNPMGSLRAQRPNASKRPNDAGMTSANIDEESLFVGGHSRYIEYNEDRVALTQKEIKEQSFISKVFSEGNVSIREGSGQASKEPKKRHLNVPSLGMGSFGGIRGSMTSSNQAATDSNDPPTSWRIFSSGTRALSCYRSESKVEPVTESFISRFTENATISPNAYSGPELHSLLRVMDSSASTKEAKDFDIGDTDTGKAQKKTSILKSVNRLASRKIKANEDDFENNNLRIAKETKSSSIGLRSDDYRLSKSRTQLKGSVPEKVTNSFVGRAVEPSSRRSVKGNSLSDVVELSKENIENGSGTVGEFCRNDIRGKEKLLQSSKLVCSNGNSSAQQFVNNNKGPIGNNLENPHTICINDSDSDEELAVKMASRTMLGNRSTQGSFQQDIKQNSFNSLKSITTTEAKSQSNSSSSLAQPEPKLSKVSSIGNKKDDDDSSSDSDTYEDMMARRRAHNSNTKTKSTNTVSHIGSSSREAWHRQYEASKNRESTTGLSLANRSTNWKSKASSNANKKGDDEWETGEKDNDDYIEEIRPVRSSTRTTRINAKEARGGRGKVVSKTRTTTTVTKTVKRVERYRNGDNDDDEDDDDDDESFITEDIDLTRKAPKTRQRSAKRQKVSHAVQHRDDDDDSDFIEF